ncbi:MAG: DUF5320 domain-containing protein [Chloroflexota bacterium]
MPGGDRTGPMGMGPMTGRAAGYCAGYDAYGYANPVPGRGFGLGLGGGWRGRGGWGGGGRGWRRGFYATGLPGWLRFGYGPAWDQPMYAAPYAPYAPEVTREQEIEALRGQAEFFKQALDDISKRLGELEKES